MDGIERVPGVSESNISTPYRASGKMVPKFQLLKGLISQTTQKINFNDFLTKDEICNLHKIISSTVDPYMRGDEELRTCPILRSNDSGQSRPDMLNRQRPHVNATTLGGKVAPLVHSRCPLEYGAVRTFDYGTITPGTLIGSIAAALQPQSVELRELVTVYGTSSPYELLETMETKDTRKAIRKLLQSTESVDNTYAAGLAGDLAEVCVYQGPKLGRNVSVGLSGRWNDTNFPRWHVLAPGHKLHWEMTDAELLGGIDSLFVAHKVGGWVNRVRRLRLSQVIDLFYQKRGIPAITIEAKGEYTKRKPLAEELDDEFFDETLLHKHLLETGDRKLRFDNYINEISAQDGISSACHRRTILKTLDEKGLKEQTFRFAKILQFTANSMVVTEEEMRFSCDAAVENFLIKAGKISIHAQLLYLLNISFAF